MSPNWLRLRKRAYPCFVRLQNSETNKALLNKTEKELLSVEKVYRQNQARREELDLELEVVDAKLRDATNTSRQNNEEEKLVTALKALKSNNDGVHGRLVDLCRPTQRKYSQAVTVAAGKDMDAIVVDTKETGYRCMDYLRLQRIGVATFLPLDTIVVPQANVLDNLRARLAKDDRYRLAVDVISCSDPKMMPAVHYAVGTTVVCDDLDSARELCFGGRQSRGGLRNQDQQQPRLKAVTLGGAVISKAGTMTGGVTREDGDGAGRWKNQDMDKLRDKKKALEAERSKMDVPDDTPGKKKKFQGGHQSQIEELRNTLSSLKSKDQFFKTDLDYTKTTLKEKETQLQATAKQVGRLKKNVASAEKARDKLNAEVKKAIDKVKAAEDTHLAPFRASTGLRDLNAYEEMMGNRRDEFNKERRAVLEHISQLEQQKVFESGRDLQQPIARLEKTIKERKAELKKKEKESADLQLKADKADEQLKMAEANLKEASVKEKGFESQVATAQAAFKETQEACAKIKKQINTEEAGLERLRGRLHETLQKARVEKVELPMVGLNGEPRALGSRAQRRHRRGSDDDDDEDDESLPATSDSNGLTQTTTTQNSRGITQYSQSDNPVMVRDQQEASTVDLSQLPDSLKKRLGDREEKKLRKEFEDKLNKIAADIESITPNMKASEAFAAATQRMTESKTDLEAAKESATKAAQTFSKIKAKRTKAFMDAFNHIEEALKTIYTDMTRSSKHPLGGNAYISLDDTDEPYKGGLKFNAMPPMKRFRDMEQLSGGEKTVAALSMLFAIHSFHPAPFFVMDEVDAALDNINLRKVCNYISQRSKSDFQCIVISLKDEFYLHSQSLVGICKDVASNSSKTLTLDLTKIDESKTASSGGKSSRKRSRS